MISLTADLDANEGLFCMEIFIKKLKIQFFLLLLKVDYLHQI